MIPIIHRVNTVTQLRKLSDDVGVEVDLRNSENGLILSHDINEKAETFEKYLDYYTKKLLVVNIKETGIEEKAIKDLLQNRITNFFLLDVEFPFILKNFNTYGDYLCLRFSAYESIESIKPFFGKIGWLWVDTYNDFDIKKSDVETLKAFKICLVSPSRWGSKYGQGHFIDKFKKLGLDINYIMVEESENF
tara:strand:+ start:508 stop:1080 length:573 start_codon:yes stop_codon:yes gene_type:complete